MGLFGTGLPFLLDFSKTSCSLVLGGEGSPGYCHLVKFSHFVCLCMSMLVFLFGSPLHCGSFSTWPSTPFDRSFAQSPL